jgi:ubiquinone/menaquinone biosynthesis C-methylase UbiE
MKPNFFQQGSPYLFHPLLTPERTAEEIDFILGITRINPGSRILDIGCGAGRHSIELAHRGFDVLGIDPSEVMIAAAKERVAEEKVNLEFRQIRGEDLNIEAEFDLAICLFTTLGQVNDREANHPLLINAYRALRSGGHLVVELQQPGWVATHLKTKERLGSGDSYVEVERNYDHANNLVTEVFTRFSPGGRQEYLLRYRLFDQNEIEQLLASAGFSEIIFYGGYESTPLEDNCPAMVIDAAR